jgi:diguanylate cyclase (GGDEF)-like protein/PAS domain S-box-containing protein
LVVLGFLLGLTPVPLRVLVVSQLGILACNILIYALIRTGFNKRFKDPSLTLFQIAIATIWTMQVMYYADSVRSGVLLVYLSIFIFGLFKLNIRQFLFLSFYTIAGYAAVISLLYRNHPESINLKIEILNIIVLAVVLPGFSLIGGYITRIKTRASDALHKIKDTELKFSTLFDSASDGIIVTRAENRTFSDANEKICTMLGYSKEEFLRLSIPDIHPPEDLDFVISQFKKLIKQEISTAKDIPVLKKDKSVFFADISASPMLLNKEDYIVGMFRDVTERRRAEALLKQSESKYRLLVDHMRDYVWLMDLNLKITYITVSAEKVMGYTQAEFKEHPIEKFLTAESFKAAMDFFAEELPQALNAPPDYVLDRTLELEFVCKDGRTIWGEVTFALIRDEQGTPVSVLSASRNITARKQIENELRASESNFRHSLDESPLGVRISNVEGDTIYANRAILDIYGYDSLAELLNTSVQERYTPESYARWQARKEKRLRGEFCPSEYAVDIVRKDGSIRHLHVFRKEIFWSGERLSQVIYNDITDRKRMEEKLRREENRFRTVIEHSSDIVVVVNLEGIITYINPAVEQVLGFKPEERIGRRGFELIHEDDLEFLADSFIALTRQPDHLPIHGEMRLRHKNGSFRILEAVGSNWVNDNVVEAVIVNYRDITERKKAEEELRKREELYTKLVNSMPDLVIQTDLNGKIEFVNDNTSKQSGYGKEDFMGQNMLHFICPEYHSKAIQNSLMIQGGKIIGPQEYELIRKGGQKIPFEINGQTLLNEDGTPYGFVRVCRNISERKLAEAALQESERKYRELSIIDALTHLFNSRHFYNQMEREMERSSRYKQPLTLLLLDLDQFKVFNDSYGHIEGDHVLSRLGHVIKQCLRDPDSAYRYGGEEFTIILPMTSSDEGIITAQRIQEAFKKEIFTPVPGKEVFVTMSIGCSQYKPKEDIKTFIRRVDRLMYQAKQNGRDRICSE